MNDPFSDVLSVLGTRSVRGTSLDASGDWALSFDGRERLKFVALMKGRCWIKLPDRPPEELVEGDLVLLADTPYVVASDPSLEPVDGMTLYSLPGQDNVSLGEGGDTMMLGGGSGFLAGSASFVLDALPSFLRIDPHRGDAEGISRTLLALHREVSNRRIGGSLVAERLAEILVVEAVRAYVAAGLPDTVGWIAALGDRRIAKALQLLHGDVARRWTLEMLAQEIGMSRSALTQRFAERVGRPPLDYLTRWRMILAERKLTAGSSVSEVAADVGYASQSAFAQAFKRITGRTPRAPTSLHDTTPVLGNE